MKNQRNRRLAAIMFKDIVGYTALMQQNEATALALRTRHRNIFDQAHQAHNGEIIQYFGDGTLSIFQSAVEAVECAIAIQQNVAKGKPLPLRIGLHLGDIIYDGTDIYGDGVNLASRIESLGMAGTILLSKHLNEELQNQEHIQTLSMGYFELKNVEQAVEIFAVSNANIKVPQQWELKGKGKPMRKTASIAVLPFVNISRDKDNEYFSDGITEEIINALSKINNLKVTSRTSSFYFKNKDIPLTQIAQELKVSSILEGSVRLAGKKVRISAQLIDTEEDTPFWSETFDRSVEDIFAVQDEISLLIADRLREYIGHFDIADKLVEAPEIQVELYKKYLQGKYLINMFNREDIEKGITILKDVIIHAPKFPLPYLSISFGYTFLGIIGVYPAHESFVKAHPFITKALELDPLLPQCQHYLAGISFWQHWDIDNTFKYLNKAIEIRPGYADAYQAMAPALLTVGKKAAALNYIDTAIQMDPFSSMNHYLKGVIYYLQELYDLAIISFEKVQSLEPNFVMSYVMHGGTLLSMGRTEEAKMLYEKISDKGTGSIIKLGGITMVYAVQGDVEKTDEGLRLLQAEMNSPLRERVLLFLAVCQCCLGRYKEAIDLYEQGVKERLPIMIMMHLEPLLKPLYQFPRFEQLVQQVHKKKKIALTPKKKYKKSSLKLEDIKKYVLRLEQFMKEEKPYLLPDLTLRRLAKLTDIHPNQLSQLLNEQLGKNFSEYVNTYRLETFKILANQAKNRHLTILALAYESGFNSKTVFNTFFKKRMGKTPREYWKEMAAT
jgi:TolB-like protein/class 3 adenylate cyclase/AraC-like DNA-binding protein/lipoprotein NlpI